MKSTRVYLIILTTFFSVNISAQLFTGGDVNLKFDTDDSSPELYNVNLRPLIGKFLSEKLAAGLTLNVNLIGQKFNNQQTKITGFGLNPFLRYYAVTWKKFSIYGQGHAGIHFTNTKDESGGTITEDRNVTSISLGIYPGLSYDITDRLSLQTSLDFFDLSYSYTIENNPSYKWSSFNLSGGLNQIFHSYFGIGAIYKF